ncbi:hypothetical protein DEO72_LG8g2182 [Vigna unguiculata]|uniref:Uncharacterized protein n=1 Tax=Vigna unguiculata TaxID=3917 RepID=A0A4D6MVM3_VIGUN|nr:hypothetical protein DEO72_LG8g2182 [Vigna unguiculata]
MHFLHLNFSLGRDSCIRRCSPICERRRVPTSHFFSSHLGLSPSRVSPSVTLEQLFLLMRFLLFAYAPSSNGSKARASLGKPLFVNILALMNVSLVESTPTCENESKSNLKSVPLRFPVNSTEQSTFGGHSSTNGARFRRSMAPMASSSGIQSHSVLGIAR